MDKKQRLLLLEDDPNLGFMLEENLQLRGYQTLRCANGDEGLRASRSGGFNLYLVDVMMPKKDGFTFAREVRGAGDETPIIFLTAKSMKEDKIEGFRVGGDDYVTKPFSMEELSLRIQAVLKRSEGSTIRQDDPNEPSQFMLGEYIFNHNHQVLERKGKKRKLTGREADLLRLMCLHENRILDRAYALTTIWGENTYFNGRSMDVFVSKLRGYLKGDANIEIINVHGRGYKLMNKHVE